MKLNGAAVESSGLCWRFGSAAGGGVCGGEGGVILFLSFDCVLVR